MPWVKVGGYRFDLDRVEVVYASTGQDGHVVTITLRNGATINLSGHDADRFLGEFDVYRAARDVDDVNRGPPGGPMVLPASAWEPDGPHLAPSPAPG